MLMLSASDEIELERFRAQSGTCIRSPDDPEQIPNLTEALQNTPRLVSMFIRARLRAGGWMGTVGLMPDEVAEIEDTLKTNRNDTMLALLNVAATLAQGVEHERNSCAVVESLAGGLYVGAPVLWKAQGIKFSMHAVQVAMMNAWQSGDNQIKRILVDSPLCPCCRQFVRENWAWKGMKIMQRPRHGLAKKDATLMLEAPLSVDMLRDEGIKTRLMGEPKRAIPIPKADNNELVLAAVEAASLSYAPYSSNFSGVAIRSKRGTIHAGRYAETVETLAGISPIEAAISHLAMCGGQLTDVAEIVLVEVKGTTSQFPNANRIALAMGGVPFKYILAV